MIAIARYFSSIPCRCWVAKKYSFSPADLLPHIPKYVFINKYDKSFLRKTNLANYSNFFFHSMIRPFFVLGNLYRINICKDLVDKVFVKLNRSMKRRNFEKFSRRPWSRLSWLPLMRKIPFSSAQFPNNLKIQSIGCSENWKVSNWKWYGDDF